MVGTVAAPLSRFEETVSPDVARYREGIRFGQDSKKFKPCLLNALKATRKNVWVTV